MLQEPAPLVRVGDGVAGGRCASAVRPGRQHDHTGGGLPYGKYDAPLESPEPYYEQMISRMISDGVNCVFTYMDSQSNVNLITAMHNQGVWPPNQCSATRKAANQCFYLTYMPFTSAVGKCAPHRTLSCLERYPPL